MIRKLSLITILLTVIIFSAAQASAESFVIDTKKSHAFIEFKVSHLGFSWILGRFNKFEGTFELDVDDPEKSSVSVKIDTASLDTNHAERDKHLRSDDFLDVKKFPEATFKSTSIERTGDETAIIRGDLTLHGVTREVAIAARHIGSGDDPWGGFRRGFEGTASFALADFDITFNLGPHSKEVELFLSVEGIRQ